MSEDDATVRLPGDRRAGDQRYATDDYEAAGQAFGGEVAPGDPTARFQPGAAPGPAPYQPDYQQLDYDTPGADKTLMLGAGEWAPERPAPTRDRLLVHVVWEVLLFLMVAGLAVWSRGAEPSMLNAAGTRSLATSVAILGALAIAVSVSLRAAVPNLAVGAIAALAGVLFIRWYQHGAITSLALAVGVALLGGLALGVLVAIFHVPGWVASLVALCGAAVAIAALTRNGPLSLPGDANLPDLSRSATWWAGGVLAASVLAGLIGLAWPVRRAVGSFRPTGDPARRPTPGAAVMVAVALTVSAGLAAGAGLFSTVTAGTAPTDSVLPYTLLPFGAALLGGVSAYGRRGGVLGTALGAIAISLILQLGAARGWSPEITAYAVAGGAILLGLIITRLIEWVAAVR